MAGIIPVAGLETDFDQQLPEVMMPVDVGFTAIQKSVYECAMAGCETIWVVCHKETQPLVRSTLGEWIVDPASLKRGHFPSDNVRRIPIYYVPIHPKDRQKRDCLGWSVLYGALTAFWISRKMSKWITPDMYYAAFPYGVYPVGFLREHRKQISSRKKFSLLHQGQGIKSGLPLGFTFNGEDFKSCRKEVRDASTHLFNSDGDRLSIKERYSARHFSLDKVFNSVNIEHANSVEVPWFYDVSSWTGYTDFISSGESLTRPKGMKYNEWNEIDWLGEEKPAE